MQWMTSSHRGRNNIIRIVIIYAILVVIYWIIRITLVPALLNKTDFSRAYYDRNGELMRLTLTNDDKYRIYTPITSVSPHIINAIILYEDKHFWHHHGINIVSILRAARQYISRTPHPIGASTITMQVARMRYNIPSKTPLGKIQQIALAIYIDLFYSKSEILDAYLNLAPFGGNIEGIGAASTIYFGKSAGTLSKIESITLATIPQNPTKRGLNTKSGMTNMAKMRRALAAQWVAKYPSDTDMIQLADMPLHATGTTDLPFLAPHFIDNMNRQNIGTPKPELRTTLDIKLQSMIMQKLNSQISSRRVRGVNNAAAILINYKTMETLAYIGSADYFNREIFGENDGVRARRSPGSTLKPLIYTAAADMGLIHGMTLLKDTQINFGVYAPENADNDFYGPVLARDALTHSRNIPAINLVREIGIKNFYNLLQRSGVSNLRPMDYYGISVALGGAEVSMLELADIYATMANLGERHAIKMLLSDDDKIIDNILSPEAYFLTLDMLAHQSTPTRKIPFTKNNKPILRHYWKTGTSSSYRDAWTAGIFGDFVLIVWVGNFDGTPNNAFSGAKTAAPIYFAIADTVQNYYASIGMPIHNNNFLRSDLNIITTEFCTIGGGLAGTYCPQKTTGYFIPGKSPITRNTVHRMIAIDNRTGLRACTADPTTTHGAVYEFWDPEYIDMFRRAGIHRPTPPAFMPGCTIIEYIDPDTAPIIVSPGADTKLVITSNNDFEPVGFIALGAHPDTEIHWFLNNTPLGTTKTGTALKYNVKMGDYTLRAIDSDGATSEIKFTVIK